MVRTWRTSEGVVCEYNPATWELFIGGAFVALVSSMSEALRFTRGF